jgi:hypothetical protein
MITETEPEPSPTWEALPEPPAEPEIEPGETPEPVLVWDRLPELPRADRLRFYDMGAERAVLGSVLIDGPAIADVLEHVSADDFSTPEHRALFAAMRRCYEHGIRPDVVTLADVSDPVYLAQLVNATPTSVQAGQYAAQVEAASRRRQIAEAAARIAEAARGGAGEDELTRRIAELTQTDAAVSTHTVAAAVPLADYIADPAPVAWALPTLAVVESVTAVVAPPESMKTFLVVQAGLACAGSGDLLGLYPDPMPFLYVSNEKSRATVRERFRRMTGDALPTEPVLILHRAGVTFGRGWDVVRRTLDELGRPALVALDTLASLSGPGFDENSGQDMALALAALRGIVTNYRATVLLAHHPAKAATGTGGATLRGHSSLFGEIDGVIGMRRHDRDATTGTLTADPKDGERVVLGWDWSPETFRLRPSGVVPLTLDSIAETVARLGDDATGDEIAAAFPGQNERTIYRRIGEAIEAGTIERTGKRRFYRYSACHSRLSLTPEWEGDEA